MIRKLIVGALCLLSGCSDRPPVRVDVSRGLPVDQLAFTISPSDSVSPAAIKMISVVSGRAGPKTTSDFLHWALTRRSDSPTLEFPLVIRYGQPPLGFIAPSVALPLAAGHYQLRVESGGVTRIERFRVRPDRIVE